MRCLSFLFDGTSLSQCRQTRVRIDVLFYVYVVYLFLVASIYIRKWHQFGSGRKIIANNVAYCITGQLTKWEKLYDKNTFKESYLNAFQLDNNKELYRIPLKDKTATILKSIDNYIAVTQDVKTDQKGNISNLLGLYSIETGKLFKKTKVKFITTRSYINDIIKLDENDKNKYLVCSNLFNYYTKNGIKLHIL